MLEFSFENLMVEIKPVTTEKYEFENQDESIGNFGPWGFRCKVEKTIISIKFSFTDVQFSMQTLVEEMKPVGTQIIEMENGDGSFFNHFLEICDIQVSDSRVEKNNFSIGSARISAIRSIQILLWETDIFLT